MSSSLFGQPIQNNLDELRESLIQVPPAPWHLQTEYAGNRETSPIAIRIELPLQSQQHQETQGQPFQMRPIAYLAHSDGASFTAEESQAITFLIHAPEDIKDLIGYVAWLRHATGQAPRAAPYAAPLLALEYEAIKQRAILTFPSPWAIRECTTVEKPGSTFLCLYSATGHEILALQHPNGEQALVIVRRLASFFVLARSAVPHLLEEAEYLLAQLPGLKGGLLCLRTPSIVLPQLKLNWPISGTNSMHSSDTCRPKASFDTAGDKDIILGLPPPREDQKSAK